jgi:hypothetical protein
MAEVRMVKGLYRDGYDGKAKIDVDISEIHLFSHLFSFCFPKPSTYVTVKKGD